MTGYDNIKLFKLDVTDIEQGRAATEQAIFAFGKIDIVVNNAGVGSYGPLEFARKKPSDRRLRVQYWTPSAISASARPT